MEREGGVVGRLLGHGVLDKRIPPLWESRPEDYHLAGEVLDLATGLIVHSRYVEERARAAGYEGPIWRIPHPAWEHAPVAPAQLEGAPLIGSFGNVNASKRIPQLLEAFARLRRERPDARLLLVGAVSPGFDLDRRLQRLGLSGEGIVREAYVEEERLWALMAACDVCVNLRSPTMGETSGSVIRQLSLGKPVVVSDVGWFAELPDEVALKVPVDDGETETLYAALELLARDEGARAAMSAAGARARPPRARPRPRRRPLRRRARAGRGRRGGRRRGARRRRARRGRGRDRGRLARGRRARAAPRRGRAWSIGCAASRRGRGSPSSSPPRSPSGPGSAAGCRRRSSSSTSSSTRSTRAASPPGAGFQVRDEPFGIVSVLYPLLLAPAYVLFDSLPDAYAAARTINAVVMSLAAIPAYLLARRAAAAGPLAARGAARGRAPVAGLHRHADDRERVLSAFLLAAWALAARARRADAAAPARPARRRAASSRSCACRASPSSWRR